MVDLSDYKTRGIEYFRSQRSRIASSGIRINELLQEAGIDYYPMAFVHDEVQLSKSTRAMAADITTYAMKDVEHHNSNVNSTANTKSEPWADCH